MRLLLKSKMEEAQKEGVKAIILLANEPADKEWIPYNMEHKCFSVDFFSQSGLIELREFFLYSGFLKRIKFPFVIYSENDLPSASILAALYLVYNGEKAVNAIKMVESRGVLNWTDEQKDFMYNIADQIKLFYLSKTMARFYETYMQVKLLRKLCPWDREQTHKSLIPELIEEPLELVQAIKKESSSSMSEELGDVLLQILLHSVIGEEEGKFSLDEVLDGLFNKMYRRHPHVFGGSSVKQSDEVLKQWEAIKKTEKNGRSVDIAKVLASLITAFDIQDEARKRGFDFSHIDQIIQKVKEELDEVKREIEQGKDPSEEIGDLLFSVVNLSRFSDVDPAHALFLSMEKFRGRFEKIREKTDNEIEKFTDEQLDKIWEQIKKDERRKKN
jgi:tetrapyrrole methylase family protein/MazG family protein